MKLVESFSEFISEKKMSGRFKNSWIDDSRFEVEYDGTLPNLPQIPGCKKLKSPNDLKVGALYAISVGSPHKPNWRYKGFIDGKPEWEHTYWEVKEPGEPLDKYEMFLPTNELKDRCVNGHIQEHAAGKFKEDTWCLGLDGKEYKDPKDYKSPTKY